MSKLKTIQKFQDEKGIKELKKVLDEDIVITEKIDAHRFSFEKRKGSIYFFGKKSNKPLTLVDRAISDLYEPAINHILSIKRKHVKEGIRYGCYFISPKFFLKTKYERSPKNHLILTDLKVDDNIILNVDRLRIHAENLEIETSNTIFTGKLPHEVKETLIEFSKTECEDVESFIQSIFPKYSSLLGGRPEGFVLRSYHKKYTYLQLNSKKDKIVIERVNTNIFELLLLEILYYMKDINFIDIKLESDNDELKYLEFMSKAFNGFIERNKDMIKENNIRKPKFLEKSGQLSIRYFSDETTLKLIKDDTYNYVLRVFISAFYNTRKPRGLIDADAANEFNEMILKIKQYIGHKDVMDFMEFKRYIK